MQEKKHVVVCLPLFFAFISRLLVDGKESQKEATN